ncbi:MAG TPA: cupredoxin domain-containing protein [Sphingomicrobium sp.]
MSLRLRRCVARAAGAGALLLASCAAAAAPRTYTVVIDKMKFGPVPAVVHKGDAIIWVNRDFLRHSATAADHSFDADLPPNAKARTIVSKTGAIPFVCRYHPGMRGVLQVK